ncbi:NAD(P)H-dependent oxidoreductase [Acinetobacter baumannii]|uniref:NAD(P)H-dependent oxidoreductase n=1 Tax=Acinetobacter baumannii TaxID=470 RepID=UPI000DE6510C|nr:NAD(P)H-dependent oxidoreductase [Acinetobacter baumannii]SSR08011.1 NADP(H) oxidoreductase [Acinetobacter baumannii]
MNKPLLLVFHPDLSQSKVNRALIATLQDQDKIDIVDIQKLYNGSLDIMNDGAIEAQRLISASHIILQFPIYWYSVPPIFKAWMDAFLTRMFYLFYEQEGQHIEGKPLYLHITVGNLSSAYQKLGQNGFTLDELMAPLKATARRCGLIWHPPHVIFNANQLNENDITEQTSLSLKQFEQWGIFNNNSIIPSY